LIVSSSLLKGLHNELKSVIEVVMDVVFRLFLIGKRFTVTDEVLFFIRDASRCPIMVNLQEGWRWRLECILSRQ
jgi:hypothetical protein